MAAATVVYRNAVLLVGGYSLETQLNELNLMYKAEMHDRTTFGATTRERKGGLFDASIDAKGFMGLTTTPLIESVLFGLVGATEDAVVIFPDGVTEGSQPLRGFAMMGVIEHLDLGGAVGVLLPISFAAMSAGYGS